MICTPHKILFGLSNRDQIEKNEVGEACSVGKGQVYAGFWWET